MSRGPATPLRPSIGRGSNWTAEAALVVGVVGLFLAELWGEVVGVVGVVGLLFLKYTRQYRYHISPPSPPYDPYDPSNL